MSDYNLSATSQEWKFVPKELFKAFNIVEILYASSDLDYKKLEQDDNCNDEQTLNLDGAYSQNHDLLDYAGYTQVYGQPGVPPLSVTLEWIRRSPWIPPLPAQVADLDPHLHCLLLPVPLPNGLQGTLMVLSTTIFDMSRTLLAQAYAEQWSLSLQNQQLVADQAKTTQALQKYQHLITEAEERTKREISEVLHSRVQSRLLVLWYRLGELMQEHPELRERLNTIRTDLDDLREQDLRNISQQLHPEALRVGLVVALQVFVTRLQGVIEVQINVDDETRRLDDPLSNRLQHALRLTVFRSIEEAIGNVLKHAHATRVEVSLSCEHSFRLAVRDNGRGFDPEKVKPGLGLLCLMARIESLAGRWGLESRPGGPTTLWAEVPMIGGSL